MITSQLHKILILLLIALGGPIAASEWPATSDFDSYVSQTMRDFKVPGAALAIVRDGKVLVAKGYGFRDVENQLPVTTETLFPIASIQKEIVERLRYLEPNKPLRQTFQYNNLMFITAGYLESVLNHSSWQEAVQKLVLTPVGMTGTLFSSADALNLVAEIVWAQDN